MGLLSFRVKMNANVHRETKIAGVAGFNVTKVAANIITLKVELGISFPILEISGWS